MIKVRKLTAKGLIEANRFLENLKEDNLLSVPESILQDDELTELVNTTTTIAVCEFPNRYEFGSYLVNTLGEVIDQEGLQQNAGFWTWICMLYFDQICPIKKDSASREIRDNVHYIYDPKNRGFYRNAAFASYSLVRAHGPTASSVLLGMDTFGEAAENWLGRQRLRENKALFETFVRLYMDKSNKLKYGARGRGAGSINRLGIVLRQYSKTYDVSYLTGSEIYDLLPPEFDRFR